jgi:hypothetical protein
MGNAYSSLKQVRPSSKSPSQAQILLEVESPLTEQTQPTSKPPSQKRAQPKFRSPQKPIQLAIESLPQEGVRPESGSSSPKQIQLMFESSSLGSEPISVSNNPFTLSELPKEILRKIFDSFDIQMIRNLMITCKSIGNCLDPLFLKALASEKYPNRATSRFIVDAIGNNDDACLWRNARFSLEGRNIPKSLSIHLFTNITAKKILSSEVLSMIIQVSESSESLDSYLNICEFLEFLFSKVSFTKLKCLMLHGLHLSGRLSRWIGALNLQVFHMAKFSFGTNLSTHLESPHHFNTLERLYVVHPHISQVEFAPEGLKKLVIYCPEPSESFISGTKTHSRGLEIILPEENHTLEEM